MKNHVKKAGWVLLLIVLIFVVPDPLFEMINESSTVANLIGLALLILDITFIIYLLTNQNPFEEL